MPRARGFGSEPVYTKVDMSSPTQRSLKYFRDRNSLVEVVERWNPHSKTRHDLFNVFDLVAVEPSNICGVQVTSDSNMAARMTKISDSAQAVLWMSAGGTIEVHGWKKVKVKRGGKAVRWRVRIAYAGLDMKADNPKIEWVVDADLRGTGANGQDSDEQ